MSTRANITINNGDSKIILYRHYDGYPTNTGIDILNRIKRSKHISDLVSDFLTATMDWMTSPKKLYEITSEIHGDIEYDYEIKVPKYGYNFHHKDADGNYTNMPTITVKERKIIETLDREYLVSWTTIHENKTYKDLLPIWERDKDKQLVTYASGKTREELGRLGVLIADVKAARERLKKNEY
jgi:hypothetical protein